MGQGSGRCCTEGLPHMGAHSELLGSASTFLWLPLCHRGQTCRGGAAEFLVLHGILESKKYLRYGRHVAFISKLLSLVILTAWELCKVWSCAHCEKLRIWSNAFLFLCISSYAEWGFGQQRGESHVWDRWAIETCRISCCPWLFELMCVKLLSLLLFVRMLCAMHLWCGVLQSGDFPIKFGFVSLIFTRDELAITSGQSRHVVHQGREIQEK